MELKYAAKVRIIFISTKKIPNKFITLRYEVTKRV